jgi:antitoxin ParD1/3/4
VPTRNVVLTEHLEAVIEKLVKSGRYQNASEVLREGLRLIERREAREDARLNALREAAGVGFADLDRGRFVDFDSFDDLEDHLTRVTEDVLASRRS